jgi:hypothetical protein
MNASSSIAVLIAACGMLASANVRGDDAQGAQTGGGNAAAQAAASQTSTTESSRDANARPATESQQTSPAGGAANHSAETTVAQSAPAGAADDKAHDKDGGKAADALSSNVIDERQLGGARGGAELQPVNLNVNQNNSNGSVSGNVATNLTTGTNNISDTAFSNSAGVPVVIQNTGNNVLIQNSTILNVQLGTSASK